MRVAVALALAGCSTAYTPGEPVSLQPQSPLGAVGDALAFEAGAYYWRGCEVKVNLFGDGQVLPIKMIKLDDWEYAEYYYNYPSEARQIRINPTHWASLNPQLKALVFAHELGHAYGLDHVKHGVMQPYIGEMFTELSPEDKVEFYNKTNIKCED